MPPTSTSPEGASPPARSEFVSRDEGEITTFFRQMYADNRTRFEVPAELPVGLVASTADLPGVGGDHLSSTVGFSMEVDETADFLSYVVEGGGVHLRRGRDEIYLAEGDSTIYPRGVPQQFTVTQMRAKALRMPMAHVARVAEEVGDVQAHRFRFTDTNPVSAPLGRYWRAQVRLVTNALLADDSPMAHPLIREETIRATALAALHVFPNTTMTQQHSSGPGHLEPAALRRAVAYVDAHAHEPVTLAEIAAAAGTEARAVQYAFRRHRDTTPLGYLRRVRLERAHRDLHAGVPTRGGTVAAIAARWGYANPSRFATTYAAIYGHPPSHTLRH